MYSLHQEIEVWYIIPAVRSELAKQLIKTGLSYEKAGKILGISKSAVSQYILNKRATKLKLPETIKNEIAKSAKEITKNNRIAVIEMERILRIIREKKCSCNLCKETNPEMQNYCKCGVKK